jgi:hypothetical protein
MKKALFAIAAASILAAPVASFAQSNGPVTRAQVRSELVQLESVGYNPGRVDPSYPSDILTAQARVNAQNAASGYGAPTAGASQSGGRVTVGIQPVYFGN